MTHQESIKEIRRQMARALAEGKLHTYCDLLAQLSTTTMTEAQRADSDEVHARMTNAYRGGW